MQYSLVKSIIEGIWMIDSFTFAKWSPLAFGAIRGASFENDDEPLENIPFLFNPETKTLLYDEYYFSKRKDIGKEIALQEIANIFPPYIKAESINADTDEEKEQDQKLIAVTPLRGIMMKHDVPCGPRGTRTIANRLIKTDRDSRVIGHILLTESGGGAADSVPEFSEAIDKLKNPILSWVDGLSASAALYANSFTEEIIASRDTDRIGSIGTMIEFYYPPKQMTDSDNWKYVRIYADQSEEKNQEFEEAINNSNFKLIKEKVLNPHAQDFIDDIKKNRPNVKDDQLKGATWNASELVGTLIDSIGDFNHAVDRVVELSKKRGTFDKPKNTQMKQFKNINSTLGVDSMESTDNHISLNEEQAESIDTALANAVTANQRMQAINSALNLEDEPTDEDIANAVTANASDLESARNELETANNRIKELEEQNEELTKKPAASTQDPAVKKDPNPDPKDSEKTYLSKDSKTDIDSINKVHEAFM